MFRRFGWWRARRFRRRELRTMRDGIWLPAELARAVREPEARVRTMLDDLEWRGCVRRTARGFERVR